MREVAKRRKPRERFRWHEFQTSLSERNFRRMFRMSKSCFKELCDDIINAVGEDVFKGEDYIKDILEGHQESMSRETAKRRRLYKCQKAASGGYICGEVKLAITLRLLAGASYLDLAALYSVGFSVVYEIFHSCIEEWICNDKVTYFAG